MTCPNLGPMTRATLPMHYMAAPNVITVINSLPPGETISYMSSVTAVRPHDNLPLRELWQRMRALGA